jgi:tRNA(Ile)-lysidine synthase
MDRLCHQVLGFIRKRQLLRNGDRVVVGFSGGPDSVALALILSELSRSSELPLDLHLAHLNHALRGAESDADEAWCRDFARSHGLDIVAERADAAARARSLRRSIEAAAREIRYDFLGRTADRYAARAVATGHQADDVAETVLLRIIRGAGVRGLGAMAATRPLDRQRPQVHLVRPLLATRKADLLDFLGRSGQAFCTDSSNISLSHTRNRVRQLLIPTLEREFRTFSVESLCALNESALEARLLFEELLDACWSSMCRQSEPAEVILDAGLYAQAAPPLRKAAAARAVRILSGPDALPALRAEHHDGLSALAHQQSGTEVSLPKGFFARREQGLVYFSRRQRPQGLAERDLPVPGSVELPEAGISLEATLPAAGSVSIQQARGRASPCEVCLRLDASAMPLKVRSRRKGDRFQPLGAAAPARLKGFFIARKVPLHQRDTVPLVLTRQGDIAWVVGHEIGERYKLTADGGVIVCLRSRPHPVHGA